MGADPYALTIKASIRDPSAPTRPFSVVRSRIRPRRSFPGKTRADTPGKQVLQWSTSSRETRGALTEDYTLAHSAAGVRLRLGPRCVSWSVGLRHLVPQFPTAYGVRKGCRMARTSQEAEPDAYQAADRPYLARMPTEATRFHVVGHHDAAALPAPVHGAAWCVRARSRTLGAGAAPGSIRPSPHRRRDASCTPHLSPPRMSVVLTPRRGISRTRARGLANGSPRPVARPAGRPRAAISLALITRSDLNPLG